MGGDAQTPEPMIYVSERADRARPVLVAGLAGAAILNGAGELSLVRETRGAPIDWGGVYGEGIRLTGPGSTRLSVGGRTVALGPATFRSIRHAPWGAEVLHAFGPIELSEQVVALPTRPGVGRLFRLSAAGPEPVAVNLDRSFEPFLSPVLVEGVKPREYRAVRRGRTVVVDSHGLALVVDSEPASSENRLDGGEWDGDRRSGELNQIGQSWSFVLNPGTPLSLVTCLAGGRERTVHGLPPLNEGVRSGTWRSDSEALWTEWIGRTPALSFPDAPLLEEGYRLARKALRMLYTAIEPGFEGLVAGYPWYSTLWCRDLAWMLPALFWLGEARWAERSLQTVFRFQARARLPILGAEAGELPMQVSPGPILLYGTSDTSLYYPRLVRQGIDHTGRTDLARRLLPGLGRIVDLGMRKTDRGSGLFVNGGELEGMRQAASFGPVRVGVDAVDTTIWDSTDRRDHAVDVQLLWLQALEATASIAAEVGLVPPAVADAADRVRAALRTRYLWPEESFVFDSLRRDGTPVRRLRPNALRVVGTGLLDPEYARAAVRRAAEPDLTAPWGVRTLSTRDPGYDPTGYHDGQVWTIATAWAAEAALAVGERELGVGYLRTNALRLTEEGGYANECYRGDRPEPFNSCFLLGFSVAPFITALFGSLWGITPHMRDATVEVRPRFPASWSNARVRGLALAGGRLSLDWTPRELAARWSGPTPILLSGDAGSQELAPGAAATIPLPKPE